MPRLGRRRRVPAERRDALWAVFAATWLRLGEEGLVTRAQMFHRLADHFAGAPAPFDHVVVDEAQDISVAELRFLAAIAGARPNGLFFAGDIGQRIFRAPFSWSSLGVEVRGRSRSVKVNYRTSHQIRTRSDLLLPPRLVEADGSEQDRRGVVSAFEGPRPEFRRFATADAEALAPCQWLAGLAADGIGPGEIAVLVRTVAEYPRARKAIEEAGLDHVELVGSAGRRPGHVALATMHQAKGMEYRAVAVAACDEGISPCEARLLTATDEASLDEIFATKRHLLYVAATRARERLWVSGAGRVSEFLGDLCADHETA
jgi:superfamily I DNA/RNA helicase